MLVALPDEREGHPCQDRGRQGEDRQTRRQVPRAHARGREHRRGLRTRPGAGGVARLGAIARGSPPFPSTTRAGGSSSTSTSRASSRPSSAATGSTRRYACARPSPASPAREANRRLHARYAHLRGKGKPANVVNAAGAPSGRPCGRPCHRPHLRARFPTRWRVEQTAEVLCAVVTAGHARF